MSNEVENADEAAEYTGPETKTITLRKPIKVNPGKSDSAEIADITLSEPNGLQISAFLQESRLKDEMAASCKFIALNAGITPNQALQMGSRDITEAMEFLQNFMPKAPSLETSPPA